MGRLVVLALVVAAAVSASAHATVATLTLTTKPSPLGLGQNLFEVSVRDAKGQPVSDAEVTLILLMPADPKTKHPEMRTEGTLNNVSGGKYNGIAIVSMAGDWEVTVRARLKGKVLAEKKVRLTAYATRPKPEAGKRK